ncbi:unnamed protein product [Rotaria socialis]|uniref:Uncharacterized protein n=1 Tax=Rotaria socialis TaxID=392032 RepID=A0A820JZV0_9BILA|nr:unnamed protein product [Rotaria socialis]CAF3606091.1 unnamed protein product [Rotaria socialis]CAF4335656.1 unnamed protein product [Rotaria socialis]CAF4425853.1 unnamed protein product [Rotaria socialis]
MSSVSMIDQYNSHENFDKLNSLTRTVHNNTSNNDQYKQKLLEKLEHDNRNGGSSFLDTLEKLRSEQRIQLAQAERNYYNQQATSSSLDLPNYTQESQIQNKHETIVTAKPPLPKASKQLPSPVFLTEERAQHHMNHRSMSSNIVRRHDDDIAFCPHRTSVGNSTATTTHDLTTNHMKTQIQSMWNEFELDDYIENRKNRHSSTAASWAGRITIPAPFALTNSMTMDSVHRKRCMHDIEAAKLQKEVDEELNLRRSFKANTVPAHVNLPLYEQLQEDQRFRREQIHQMTREYLSSISKPFSFDSREKAKTVLRRHSYSGGDMIQSDSKFKAKPLPDFYYQTRQENEQMKEQEVYRSIRRNIRSKELLRKSRLPFSNKKSKQSRRSMSANDLARIGYEEFSFKPKTNSYYVPNYDKLHSKFTRNMEQSKRMRSPTKCKPFLLYTNLIPSKKEKILDDIRKDHELKHSQTFRIKGKQMPTKSASLTNLSASFQQSEAIPTKQTEAQRLREAVGKKKRREQEHENKLEETLQRSKSAKDRKIREEIRERTKLQDQAVISKGKRDENARKLRQSMRRSEDDYAKKLDEMKERVQQRPLLIQQDSRQKAVRELERKIQYAMNIADVTEQDLIRQQLNSLNGGVTTTTTTSSS